MSTVNFLPKAIEHVKRAAEEDKAANYKEAFRLYSLSLEYFMTAMKCIFIRMKELYELEKENRARKGPEGNSCVFFLVVNKIRPSYSTAPFLPYLRPNFPFYFHNR